jgi:hypothetical protein
MAIQAHALVTVSELKDELNVSGTARDATLEEVANRTTALIEGFLDRKVVERSTTVGTVTTYTTYTEYHTLDRPLEEIYLREWPIVAITSVQELQTFPSTYATALVEGTTYLKSTNSGKLVRIGTGGAYAWPTGLRGVKVVYRGGYTALSSVPYEIRDVARRLGAMLFKELDRGQQGVSGYSDSIGNFTRFGPAKLTDDMKEALAPYKRPPFDQVGVEVE